MLCLTSCGFRGNASPYDDAGPIDASLDAAETTARLWVADYNANQFHRYAIEAGQDQPSPPRTTSLARALTPFLVPSTGELLVAQYGYAAIARYTTPLGIPTFAGSIRGNGLSNTIETFVDVDGAIFVGNPDAGNVLRFGIDRAGGYEMVGSLPLPNARGLAFDPVTRSLYVTQCCGSDSIIRYALDANADVGLGVTLSGNGLWNPHGIAIAPWREVFVANANTYTILRFAIDASGNLSPHGEISGNDLAIPIAVAFAPWGELFVTNQGNGKISRFVFDDTTEHVASARGGFVVDATSGGVYWGVVSLLH